MCVCVCVCVRRAQRNAMRNCSCKSCDRTCQGARVNPHCLHAQKHAHLVSIIMHIPTQISEAGQAHHMGTHMSGANGFTCANTHEIVQIPA
jgi:hypothetical protein